MLTAILLIIPFLAGIIILTAKEQKQARNLALISSVVTLLASVIALVQFNQASADVQHTLNLKWIPTLGINFHIGMDGISLLLVMLTTVLVPLIIYSTTHHQYENPNIFYSLILFMQMALIGVFAAQDGFLFYIFWELALIPIYFICLGWGGENRTRITFKFFVYTLAGSLFMLAALIYLYLQTPGSHSFDWKALVAAGHSLPSHVQGTLFWGLFLAFAVKIPVFPFHTWQPDTYTNAPTPGTMLLSGIMLKMGLYGLLRWLLPIVPAGVAEWGSTAMVMGIIGIIYGSMIAMVQNDFKRLIAYSSIAHVGLIAAAVFSLNAQAFQGSVIQMISHGINVVGLFFICDVLARYTGTRLLSEQGGIRNIAPGFATLFMIVMLGSVALPLTNGFVGEFLLLNGLYQYSGWMAMFGGFTIILGAVYMLNAYRQSMLGEVSASTAKFPEISGADKNLLVIIVGLIIVFGVYPKPLLDISEASVASLLEHCKPGALN
jgi:NADH-quinone oxidoreductase subunit M